MNKPITFKLAEQYINFLAQEEKSTATQKLYKREILRFIRYLAGR